MFKAVVTIAVVVLLGALAPLSAQQQTIKRTPLQKFDMPGTSYETVIGIAEIVPTC